MQTGTKISGIAHVLLIAAAVFGGAFRSEPLPFQVHEVSVISPEEFAALSAPRRPETPTPPAASAESPEPVARPDPVPDPQADAQPEPAPQPDPVTNPEVTVVPPPALRPVERVAPDPVAKPPEPAKPDAVEQPEIGTAPGAEAQQAPQQATAPEEASDQIVTEVDKVASLAPLRSPRPPRQRPAPAKAAAPAPQRPAPDTANAVNAALAEALAGEASAAEAPVGPPLSAGEKDALRVAVSQCWNVGSLSTDALATTVVVAVALTPDGKPVSSSIRMLSQSGGTPASARDAFAAARRAIMRCGARGFALPPEKYGHWRDIEMTFNPERMRIK
ncbi:energy transducer TonB [Sedimentitalea sp. HM32M-2]|uniref:energy transducer TonB n=1 Tax=Sedimentitalea sp. HM32M-2 TaxID=3351566 RepID=UPI00363D925F